MPGGATQNPTLKSRAENDLLIRSLEKFVFITGVRCAPQMTSSKFPLNGQKFINPIGFSILDWYSTIS